MSNEAYNSTPAEAICKDILLVLAQLKETMKKATAEAKRLTDIKINLAETLAVLHGQYGPNFVLCQQLQQMFQGCDQNLNQIEATMLACQNNIGAVLTLLEPGT